MNTKYVKLFEDNLKKCGYSLCVMQSNTYKYNGIEYGRVEVRTRAGEYIIQAFVLMSEEQCKNIEKNKNKFPFYRTYNQWNEYGYFTPPACNVAVYIEEKKEWEIHASCDLKLELTSPDFLKYDKAVERFQKRLEYVGNKKLRKKVAYRALSFLGFVILYIAAYVMSANGLLGSVDIPLNSAVIGAFILMILLLLLPPLIPYIRSISINGFGLDLNWD